jgi:MSHA pilin protein MshD
MCVPSDRVAVRERSARGGTTCGRRAGPVPPRPTRAGPVRPRPSRARSLGASLVELVVAIAVVGIVVSAAFGALARHGLGTTDPFVAQQALAAARGLLDEVLAQGLDTTDPDGGADALGPEAGEARGSPAAPFDHVNDYHGYASNGIVSFDGTPVAGLEAYSATVTVSAQGVADMSPVDGWWVRVAVTGPGDTTVVLEGFRARLGS